jgi:hypothetical protein
LKFAEGVPSKGRREASKDRIYEDFEDKLLSPAGEELKSEWSMLEG